MKKNNLKFSKLHISRSRANIQNPDTRKFKSEPEEIRKKIILNCLINSQGRVLLGGDPIETKNISRVVKQKIQENEKLIVSVKSHEKTRYKDYVAVIDQLKRANAKRISIAETGD